MNALDILARIDAGQTVTHEELGYLLSPTRPGSIVYGGGAC